MKNENKKVVLTLKQFAQRNGLDYQTAVGLTKACVHFGQVSEAGRLPQPSGKGKPSTLYEFPEKLVVNFKLDEVESK